MLREEAWQQIDQNWDLLIIGGGVTGAGLLREAARLGLRCLLVEQRDFAWGTSSRSSKLVHGGLRYLKEGKIGLTRNSVLEREGLLRAGPGLVEPLGFLLSVYDGDHPGRWIYELGLTVYDLLALQWDHHYYSPEDFRMLAPRIASESLQGGFRYGDAQTDDARLVLRLLDEAQAGGAQALNYVRAEELLYDDSGQVCGARLRDMLSGAEVAVRARALVSASGAWADELRGQLGAAPAIRPLRGSHLIFSAWRLPVAQSISFLHPLDGRPVFIFPWEGATLVGTTDVDHAHRLDEEPAISPQETAYLMAAVESQFPSLHLGLDDIQASFAGVRPVIGTGKADPSKESRDHVVWNERGLLTLTGGKLTTFRLIALDALHALRQRLPDMPTPDASQPVLAPAPASLPGAEGLDEPARRRLLGRYAANAASLVAYAHPGELAPVPGALTLWAELRWAAHAEQVAHLEDLLLRRTRLALLLPQGGADILPALKQICQAELGWDEARWQAEESAYRALWQRCYSRPAAQDVPDWRIWMRDARRRRRLQRLEANRRRQVALAGSLGVLAGLALALSALFLMRRKRS